MSRPKPSPLTLVNRDHKDTEDAIQVLLGDQIKTPSKFDNSSFPITAQDPDEIVFEERPKERRVRGKAQLKRIIQVQHVMTSAGRMLYTAMYGAHSEKEPVRICRRAYSELAYFTSISLPSIKRLIRHFKDIGIIKEIASHDVKNHTSKAYEVYSYTKIMECWRKQGISHFRHGDNAILCDSDGKPKPFNWSCCEQVSNPITDQDNQEAGSKITPAAVIRISTDQEPLIGREIVKKRTTTTELAELIRAHLPDFDDQAVTRLWRECQQTAPGITAAQIAELALDKLRKQPRATNPVGLILSTIPSACQMAQNRTETSQDEARRIGVGQTTPGELEASLRALDEEKRLLRQRMVANG